MLLFNHPLIANDKKFSNIKSKEDIAGTLPNSVVCFELLNNIKLAQYCKKNSVSFALIITSKKDAIFANALGASFVFTNKKIARDIQKVAECYMFDTKNILAITSDGELDFAIENEIDGVIYL